MTDDIRDSSHAFRVARAFIVTGLTGAAVYVGYKFTATALGVGIEPQQSEKSAEGKCGEGTCGDAPAATSTDKSSEGKCGEGSCGDGS